MLLDKKILYLHGMFSSGNSRTPENFRRIFPEIEIIAPDLPIDPTEAMSLIRRIVEERQPEVVCGSALGGFFAQLLRGVKTILVNPNFEVSKRLAEIEGGKGIFLNPREDGVQEFTVTPEIIAGYEALEATQFEGITDFDKENTFAYFGKSDRKMNYSEEYLKHYESLYFFDGEHRMTYSMMRDKVAPLLRRLL